MIKKALLEGPKCFTDLLEDEKIDLAKPNLSKHLNELRERGEIVKERDPDDRRKRIYRMAVDFDDKRQQVFINELNAQLDEILTVKEIEKILDYLSSQELNFLEYVADQSQPAFFSIADINMETSLLDALWHYDAVKNYYPPEKVESSINRENLEKMFPELKTRQNLPEFSEGQMNRIVREVKKESNLSEILENPKFMVRKAKGLDVVDSLDSLIDLLDEYILIEERAPVALVVREKQYEIWAYRISVQAQKDLIDAYYNS